jgi:hypothetical protein
MAALAAAGSAIAAAREPDMPLVMDGTARMHQHRICMIRIDRKIAPDESWQRGWAEVCGVAQDS